MLLNLGPSGLILNAVYNCRAMQTTETYSCSNGLCDALRKVRVPPGAMLAMQTALECLSRALLQWY